MNDASAAALLAADPFAGAHLQRRVWRLVDPARADEALRALPADDAPQLVEARVPADATALLAQLTGLGFTVADVNVQLDADAATLRAHAAPAAVRIRAATADDRAAVGRIAADNLVLSRFHLDPALDRGAAARLKHAWATNWFDGRRGDRLLVAEAASGVGGFLLTLEHGERGVIDLVALDPPLRGAGVAGALIGAWLHAAPALQRVVVGTQLANAASLRAYQRLGFRHVAATYVLHLHRLPRSSSLESAA